MTSLAQGKQHDHDRFERWLSELTAGGLVTVRSYPPAAPGISLPTMLLGGGRLAARLPDPVHTFSQIVVFELRRHGYGFQAMPSGAGPLSMPHWIDFDVEGPIEFRSGRLVMYRARDRNQPMLGLTVWQGPHHDLLTGDYGSLREAVDGFERVDFTDRARGLTVRPRDRRTRIRHQAITIEAGDLLYDVTPLLLRPVQEGAPGRFGHFYWRDETTLLFQSATAQADITVWRRDPDGDGDEAAAIGAAAQRRVMQGLSLEWRSPDAR